jgi:hypothetical protein
LEFLLILGQPFGSEWWRYRGPEGKFSDIGQAAFLALLSNHAVGKEEYETRFLELVERKFL